MNDQEFLKAFENGTLPHHSFPHRGHIRMAWLYLREYELEVAIGKIREGILQFAGLHRAPQKYHETITLFWIYMVYAAIQGETFDAFEAFAMQNPDIFDKGLIDRYFSKGLLHSTEARANWVEPDLLPLPIAER